MPSDNAIGSGAIILSTNADKWVAGLNSAQKQAQKWATGTQNILAAGMSPKGGGASGIGDHLDRMSARLTLGEIGGGASGINKGTLLDMGVKTGMNTIDTLLRGGFEATIAKLMVNANKGDSTFSKIGHRFGNTLAAGVMVGAVGLKDTMSALLSPGQGDMIDRITQKFYGIGEAVDKVGANIAMIGAASGKVGEGIGFIFGGLVSGAGKVLKAGADILAWLHSMGGGLVGSILGSMHSAGALAESLRPKARTDDQARGLDAVSSAVGRIDYMIDELTIKFLTALAPGITAASNVIVAALDGWSGSIDKIAAGFGALIFAGTELGGAILGQITGMVSGTDNWANSTSDAEHVVFEACKNVALGFANVWDNVKVGAGATIQALGGIIKALAVLFESVGMVKHAFSDTFGKDTWAGRHAGAIYGGALGAGAGFLRGGAKGAVVGGGVGAIAGGLLDQIDVDGLTNKLVGLSVKLEATGGKLANVGAGTVGMVNAIFNGIEGRYAGMKNLTNELNAGSIMERKLAPAADVTSKEAYSIVAQFNARGRDIRTEQQALRKAVEDGNRAIINRLDGIKGALEGAPMLKVLER